MRLTWPFWQTAGRSLSSRARTFWRRLMRGAGSRYALRRIKQKYRLQRISGEYGLKVIFAVKDLSRLTHDLIYSDYSQSLCARAWQRKHVSTFWRIWCKVFTDAHCEASYRYYHRQ